MFCHTVRCPAIHSHACCALRISGSKRCCKCRIFSIGFSLSILYKSLCGSSPLHALKILKQFLCLILFHCLLDIQHLNLNLLVSEGDCDDVALLDIGDGWSRVLFSYTYTKDGAKVTEDREYYISNECIAEAGTATATEASKS